MNPLEKNTLTESLTQTDARSPILRESVRQAIRQYLNDVDGQPITNVYDMLLSEVEEPLLRTIMQYTRQNQSEAARCLGLSRGTLRQKLERYGMLISHATQKRNVESKQTENL